MPFETVIIGSATLIRGDCLAVMPGLGQVDSIVCDPPYGINFMNSSWDDGVAFRPETWRLAYDVLKPGGFLLAFGGTRTWHRLACAIEDAGFVVQDTIAWIYGTGFPKGGALLKPAFEPIIMAYKPGGKRELSIDECRIVGEFTSGWSKSGSKASENIAMSGANYARDPKPDNVLGRWPANVCHDGSDEVLALFPQSAGQQGNIRGTEPSATGDNGIYGHFNRVPFNKRIGEASAVRRYTDKSGFAVLPGERRTDSGSAARFFYCAKAGKADRAGSKHPTVKPQALMRWLVSLVTPPGGTVLDPFGGSGSTAQAALAVGRRPILIEREQEWFADICRRIESIEAVLAV